MSDLLRAYKITFAYGDAPVLRDVGVTLATGEVVALLGPNGSGKSTLIRVLLGQLSGSGSIHWDGKAIGHWRRRELARVVAYLPQTPASEPGQTVLDALRLGRAPYWGAMGLESAEDERAILAAAQTLELNELLHRPMDELSGGQRQRVFLGRCLAQEPKAMLLDEPNTFLDLAHQVGLCRTLRDLARTRGIGVLMASHDLNLAGGFADRIILLDRGSVAASGNCDSVYRPEILQKIYGVELERIDREKLSPVIVPRL
jgi:iron complex transport system ATP-binding protein